jgi:uncharacterized membrane protein
MADWRPQFGVPRTVPRTGALVFVFLWFFIGGIAHFAATQLEMRIVPPYIPWPRFIVLTTGVFELLGALGVVWPRFRAAAGAGLLLLTLAVTPANVYMLQHWDLFSVPYWALAARLPLQIALLGVIAWSTRVTTLFRR